MGRQDSSIKTSLGYSAVPWVESATREYRRCHLFLYTRGLDAVEGNHKTAGQLENGHLEGLRQRVVEILPVDQQLHLNLEICVSGCIHSELSLGLTPP